MYRRFKNVLIVAVVVGICFAGLGSATAQSYLDAGAKMRGDFGHTQRGQASPTYRMTMPSEQRSFSYEPAQTTNPSQPSSKHTDSGKAGVQNQPANPPAPMVQRETRTYRSYS